MIVCNNSPPPSFFVFSCMHVKLSCLNISLYFRILYESSFIINAFALKACNHVVSIKQTNLVIGVD